MAEHIHHSGLEPIHSHRVSWGAVSAGVLIALMAQMLFTVLGLAVGLTAFTPGEGLGGLGLGSGIWLTLSSILSIFIGAWTTSWWANDPFRGDGVLHGVLTWSLFMLLTMALIGMGIGTLFGSAMNLVAAGLAGAGEEFAMEQPAEASPGERVAIIQERLAERLPEAMPVAERIGEVPVPPEIRAQIAAEIAAGNDSTAVQLIIANSNLSQAEAQQIVQEAQMTGPEAAQVATERATQAAWWTFIAAILSLIAAAIGGRLGTRRNPYLRETGAI